MHLSAAEPRVPQVRPRHCVLTAWFKGLLLKPPEGVGDSLSGVSVTAERWQ